MFEKRPLHSRTHGKSSHPEQKPLHLLHSTVLFHLHIYSLPPFCRSLPTLNEERPSFKPSFNLS